MSDDKRAVKAAKSSREGYVSVRVSGSAYRFGASVSSTVVVDLDMDAARALHNELAAAIAKADEKMKATAESEARRKAWRDREVAAGRMKIISLRN